MQSTENEILGKPFLSKFCAKNQSHCQAPPQKVSKPIANVRRSRGHPSIVNALRRAHRRFDVEGK
eukprot:4764777-Amphidinium_carterae.1